MKGERKGEGEGGSAEKRVRWGWSGELKQRESE